ncbi:sialate O-acetylesterase [Leadbetterella byssophila]|uniref:sialate O-acetylesterase n=1 Tax=Leadbetterella byssophila TaxID=316068 RepID=UPI0039A2AF9E
MKPLLLLFFLSTSAFSQVQWTKIPADYQLFPRDEKNSAEVEFQFTSKTDTEIQIQVYGNDQLLNTLKESVKANTSNSIKIPIEAKPISYDFQIKIANESITKRGIVAGDFIVMYGQSNIKALSGIDHFKVDTKYLRNFDTKNPAEPYSWSTADLPYGSVGVIGLKLQQLILDKYGIPTCILNAGVGGASLYSLIPGNGLNYQTLMDRVEKSGAKGNVKAIIWRQGEAETCNWYMDIIDYPILFGQFMDHINKDFPEIIKFYNIQTGILHCNQMEEAGQLREYMRSTKYLFPKVETTNMHHLPLSDDVHYSSEAYIQTAEELLPLLGRDIYQDQNLPEIHPPDIQKIWRNAMGDTLILVFEEGQKIQYPTPKTINGFTWKLEDYFYINTITAHQDGIIQKAWAEENRVYLKLNWPINGGFVTYLPSYATSSPPKQEVHLTNSRGLRAMSFYQFPILPMLPTPRITNIQKLEPGKIRLTFSDKGNYIVERRSLTSDGYTVLVSLNNADSYTDEVDLNQRWEYRIKRVDEFAQSDYSNTVSHIPPPIVEDFAPRNIMQNEKGPFVIKGKNFGTEKGKVNEKVEILTWKDSEITFNLSSTFLPGNFNLSFETADEQTFTVQINVDALLPIENNYLSIAYPNPVSTKYLNISSTMDILEMHLILPTGQWQKLKSKKLGKHDYQIDTEHLSSGQYILLLQGQKEKEILRFTKY